MTYSILITGAPADGFTFYGPFPSPIDAIEAADAMDSGENWSVARLWPYDPSGVDPQE